ncbi:MAG TPA: efflux RND transporter periplasmic adaptor subunit [Candidatus Alistipes merdigallinarum]|nr:efflux RND transporter periplasmic adaptor subunit [Candidatus Alistipes merdigallinarum]
MIKFYYCLSSILLVGMVAGCGGAKEKEKEGSDAAKIVYVEEQNLVDTVVLRMQPFNKQIVGNGKLRAVTKSVLHFNGTGEIVDIRFKNGESVRKGEVIAQLDSTTAYLNLKQAQLTLDKSKIDRMDALIGFGYSDTTNIPEEHRKVADIRSGYASAVNNLKQAEIALANTTLIAPFGGKIANLQSKVYEQPQGEFCTLIDDRVFDVDFNLLESEIGFVRKGQRVKVAVFNAPDHYFDGEVTQINPLVDDKGQINVRAQVNNATGELLEGMNVSVLVENMISDQLVVPKSAVVIRDNQEVLFRMSPEGRSIWTYVHVLMSNSDSHVVAANTDKGAELNVGDVIITSGNLNLADNSEVVVK